MAYTAGFSVNVGDPTKASDVTTLAANDDYLKAAVDAIMADSATPSSTLKATVVLADGVTATTQSAGNNTTRVATTAFVKTAVDASSTDPAGSDTQIQYNNDGAFGASANLTFDSSGNLGVGSNDPDSSAPTGSSTPRIIKVAGGTGIDKALQIQGYNDDHGLDLWTDVSTGDAYIDQRGDHANYDLRLRTRTTGTPIDAMTITGGGNVSISGSLSKGSGSFKIDHPLPEKTDTHHLVHSFVEGPQADLIYRGTATLSSGTAAINLDTAARMTDGTFVALNTNVQAFTSNESGWDAVRGSVSGNVLTIASNDDTSTATVSWMVVGERKDQHMLDTEWTDSEGRVITEPQKPVEEEDDEDGAEE